MQVLLTEEEWKKLKGAAEQNKEEIFQSSISVIDSVLEVLERGRIMPLKSDWLEFMIRQLEDRKTKYQHK